MSDKEITDTIRHENAYALGFRRCSTKPYHYWYRGAKFDLSKAGHTKEAILLEALNQRLDNEF